MIGMCTYSMKLIRFHQRFPVKIDKCHSLRHACQSVQSPPNHRFDAFTGSDTSAALLCRDLPCLLLLLEKYQLRIVLIDSGQD
jgi:hypothetical protein